MNSTYRVWFEQVNETYIYVEAETEEMAVHKAQREWLEEYGEPYQLEIVEPKK
jgi:hypothetical protein